MSEKTDKSEQPAKPSNPEMTLDTLIINYRDYYGSYHNHKEKMAYAATTLYLAAATWVILEGSNPWGEVGPVWLLCILIFAGIATGFAFVYWQLDKRDFAANIVKACTTLAARNFKPKEYGGLDFPQDLVEKLKKIKETQGSTGPRFSKWVTLFVMLVWTAVALVSIGWLPLTKLISCATKVIC